MVTPNSAASQPTHRRRSISPVDLARSDRATIQTYSRSYRRLSSDSTMPASRVRPGSGAIDFWTPKDYVVSPPAINTLTNPVKLMLPWTLPIPEVVEVDLERFYEIYRIPISERKGLRAIRQSLAMSIKGLTEGVNQSLLQVEQTYNVKALPQTVQTKFRSPTGINPTHIMAISNYAGKVTFYPIHAIVFSANCTAIPRFPRTHVIGSVGRGVNEAELFVCVIQLPFPDAFPTFYAYLYRKNLTELHDELVQKQLPTALANTQYLPPGLGVTPGAEGSIQPTIADRRTRIAMNIYGVWAIARTLKLVDPEFYKVVKECYEEVVAPLKIANGYRRPSFANDWPPPNTLAVSPAIPSDYTPPT